MLKHNNPFVNRGMVSAYRKRFCFLLLYIKNVQLVRGEYSCSLYERKRTCGKTSVVHPARLDTEHAKHCIIFIIICGEVKPLLVFLREKRDRTFGCDRIVTNCLEINYFLFVQVKSSDDIIAKSAIVGKVNAK